MTGHSSWLPRIVAWHARLSLARKLTFVGVLTSIVSLVIAMTAVLAWDLSSARTRLVRDTGMLADVIGSNSTAAVAFGDAKAATDTLRALTVNESIVSAAIWAADGNQLARFERVSRPNANRKLPARAFDIEPHHQWSEFTDGALLLARPIVLDGEVIGTVVIESDLSVLWSAGDHLRPSRRSGPLRDVRSFLHSCVAHAAHGLVATAASHVHDTRRDPGQGLRRSRRESR